METNSYLPSIVLGWARNRSWSTMNRVSSTTKVSLSPNRGLLFPAASLAIPATRLSRWSKLNLDLVRPSWSPPQGNMERPWKPHWPRLLSLSDIMWMSPSSLLLVVSRLWVLDLFTRQGLDFGVPRQLKNSKREKKPTLNGKSILQQAILNKHFLWQIFLTRSKWPITN